MKIALAQINTTVGALEGNRRLIQDTHLRAAALGADLVVYPELTLTGYPPKDLLELPDFIERNVRTLEGLAQELRGPGALLGYVHPCPDSPGKGLHNAAALIDGGKILSRHFKSLLPTYDVFDEARHFEPAPGVRLARFRGEALSITICEDFWNNTLYTPRRLYSRDPIDELAEQGPALMLHIAASPYSVGKRQIKAGMYRAATQKWGIPLVQVNLVGGNDNLIFDGWSNVWGRDGSVLAQAREFEEDLLVYDFGPGGKLTGGGEPPYDNTASLYRALVVGIRDYMHKCGFKRVLIGLSGGIDSALTAALAVDALGAENVVGISMPSRFSSGHSRDDARVLAENLGIEYHTIAIEPVVQAFLQQLDPLFHGTPFGLAEENLQSRTRGNLLMAISNKFGYLVLSTGNKSEMAVGYCTLYGDMSGGLCVLGDVLKTQVYELSRYANRERERIPLSSIEKPPSAELRPDQLDTDSLPPYDILDPLIAAYVEEMQSPEQIIGAGFDAALVRRVLRMIDNTEYKRQQAALTLKVSRKAFGSGRRMPIARGQ
jgi:NAD+ synthase (glutamine-hydrolysing)